MDGDGGLNIGAEKTKCGFAPDFTNYYLLKRVETVSVKAFNEYEEHIEARHLYLYEPEIEEPPQAVFPLPSSFNVPTKVPLTLQIGSWLGVITIWILTIFHILTSPQLLDRVLMVIASLVLTWIWIGISRWAKQESLKGR